MRYDRELSARRRSPSARRRRWLPYERLLIYLTDLEGDAGDKPVFPVLWTVPECRAQAPWG